MNVGDLKFSLFLDVRPFAESVKTALNILSTLNKSALQSLKFQDPKINISGIDSELKKLDSTLDKYKKEVSESTNSNEKLSVSFSKTSTSSVVLNDKLQNLFLRFQGFQSSLAILKSTLGEFLGKFNQFQSALLGLESISTFKGIDPQNSKDAIKNLNLVKTGLLSVADASTSFKNLLAANFTLEQTVELVNRLGDSAAFGRQESLSFGDAVRSATEGIKNGNSILVDNAGVTKNLSVMLEQAGFKAQDLMKAGEDAGVRMAIFNGIIGETTGQLGNADKLLNSSQGGLIKFEKSINDLKIAFGGIVSSLTPLVTGPLITVNNFLLNAPQRLKNAALAFGAVGTALFFLNGQLGYVTKGFLLINALIIGLPASINIFVGGLALIFAGIIAINGSLTLMNIELAGLPVLIGLVVTAATAFASAFGDMSSGITDMNSYIEESKQKISEQSDNINALINVNEALKNGMILTGDEQKKYNESLDKVKSIYPEVISGIDKKTKSESVNADVLDDLIRKEKEKLQIYKDAQAETVAGEVSDLTQKYVDETAKIDELNNKLKDGAKVLKEEFSWDLNPFDSFESYLKKASKELIDTSNKAVETKKKLVELLTTSLKNNTLTPLLKSLRTSLGESKEATDLLKSSVSSMANNIINRFINIAGAGKSLTSVFKLIALSQNLLEIGRQIGSDAVMQKGESILSQINDAINKMESQQKNTPEDKSNKNSSRDSTSNVEKEKADMLEEYNKKLAETESIISDIQAKLKNTQLRPDEITFLLEQLSKYNKILDEYKNIDKKPADIDSKNSIDKITDDELAALEKVNDLKIDLMDNQHKKKLAQLKAELDRELSDIESLNISREKKDELKKLTNKKFNEEKNELGIDLGDFNTALDLTQQIQSLLNTGSHTVLSKFLNALQIVQQIVALLQSLQLAQGIFSFISKIFGLALAPLTGGASAAGTMAGMPSGSSGGNLSDRYSQVINYINTNQTKVSKEPYFVSLKADGRELKAVIKQVDKIDDNRLK